jgi:pyruvate-formate lyase-activating enzyme
VGCCTKKCEEINGIRFKARKNMVVIEIWIRNIDKDDELEKLREWIVSSTFLNPDTPVELITFHKE